MSKNITKDKILDAEQEVFTKKGFAGASISKIAKVAQINQSLIYHHFKSKEDLWICVKKYCVDEATKDFKAIRHDTLENFVQDLIDVRFSVYTHKSMRMLIHWQALEPDVSQFYHHNMPPHPLFDISTQVKALQKKKLIRQDQDYQVLSGLVFSLSSYVFFDFSNAYNLSKKQETAYKALACEVLIQSLKSKEHSNNDK